ncbi:MAG: acetate kinase [Oscillospiraceae bacterium]|nr:acetate kinase [Oscillospiraceae bacterium]
MKILVINAGSSSLKYQLIDMENESLLAKGLCERIGIDGRLTHKPQNGKPAYEADVPFPTHKEAIEAVLEKLTSAEYGVVDSMSEIGAVGHRVLHGGSEFTESCLVDDACEAAIKKCFPLGPLHNPANLMGIKACQAVMPGTPQVAVFDTSFGMSMAPKAYIYALPYEYYENDSLRRYGFHGTSHRFVSARACEIAGKPGTRVINCHLGNGSSVSASVDGKCVDTSMGLTPLAGVPMGTRSGDCDPALLQFIMNKYGYNVDEMLNILNKKSGVLGISGVSSDFRDLDDAADNGNERARLALDKFAYEVKKYIGAYAAALGGVDMLTFTAGVGENSASMRANICEGLEYLGVKLDPELNKLRGDERKISAADSKVDVYVIPTNEELMIARDTLELVSK